MTANKARQRVAEQRVGGGEKKTMKSEGGWGQMYRLSKSF